MSWLQEETHIGQPSPVTSPIKSANIYQCAVFVCLVLTIGPTRPSSPGSPAPQEDPEVNKLEDMVIYDIFTIYDK